MASPSETARAAILGVPFDRNKKPDRVGTVKAFEQLDAKITGVSAGAIIRDSRANLNAVANAPANQMTWVLGDSTPANNGVYENTGTPSAPVWTRRGALPYGYIHAINVGDGTANAIAVTSAIPVPTEDGAAEILIPIVTPNTSETVTISINGGTPLPVKTQSGGKPSLGGLTGFVKVIKLNSTYRMLSDQASAALQAAAEGFAADAKVEADRATDAADNASAIAGFDGAKLNELLTDAALTSIYAAKGAGFRLFGNGNISDGFGGNDGLDGASDNVVWDPDGRRLVPEAGAFVSISKSLGTPIGNMTALGGLASAFDGITAQATAAASNSNPSVQAGYVGKNFTSNPQRIYAVNVYGTTDGGYDTAAPGSNITLQLRAKNGAAPASATDGILLGTTLTVDANGIVKSIVSSDTETRWDYVWVSITSDTFSYVTAAEIDFFKPGAPLNMTIVTATVELDASPVSIAASLIIRPYEALVLNTDIVLQISRDGGTTWVPAALIQSRELGPDRFLKADPVTMTGPSGTEMQARLTTPTSKDVDVRGLRLEWK